MAITARIGSQKTFPVGEHITATNNVRSCESEGTSRFRIPLLLGRLQRSTGYNLDKETLLVKAPLVESRSKAAKLLIVKPKTYEALCVHYGRELTGALKASPTFPNKKVLTASRIYPCGTPRQSLISG